MDDTNFQIKNITLSNAIKNWFFPPESGADYKARAQSAVRLLLKQAFQLDHAMDSNATFLRVDAVMRKIKAERGMNDMDFIRYMRHLNSIINILHHKQVFDNHGQATIRCMPPGTAEHLEAAVVEMVYDCQEQKQDDIKEVTEHFNQQRVAAATDYQNNLAIFNNSVKSIEKAREQFKFYAKILEIAFNTCRVGGNIHTIKRIKEHSLDLWNLFLNQMPHHMAVLTQNTSVIEYFVQEGVLHKDALQPTEVTADDLKDLELLNAAAKNKISLFVSECTKNLNQEHNKLLDGLKKLNDSEKQIKAKIDSELRKSLDKLEAHYAEQIKTNIQILAAYDSNFETQAIAYEKERQAIVAAEKEARRTMKRKKKQAIYKGIAGVVVGAIIAPFAPALTLHIYSGIPALGLAVIEGAAFGAISSAVAGGNIEKSALQGGICAGIGSALSSSTKFTNLSKSAQGAIRAVPTATVSTAINGGNPLKNVAAAVLTSYVGESLVPSNTADAATKARTELTAGQVINKSLQNATRGFVEGVPTALLRGETLGAAVVAGSIGALQSGASSAAGDAGSRVAADLRPRDNSLGNTAFLTAPRREQHAFPAEPDARPEPVKQDGKPNTKVVPKKQESAPRREQGARPVSNIKQDTNKEVIYKAGDKAAYIDAVKVGTQFINRLEKESGRTFSPSERDSIRKQINIVYQNSDNNKQGNMFAVTSNDGNIYVGGLIIGLESLAGISAPATRNMRFGANSRAAVADIGDLSGIRVYGGDIGGSNPYVDAGIRVWGAAKQVISTARTVGGLIGNGAALLFYPSELGNDDQPGYYPNTDLVANDLRMGPRQNTGNNIPDVPVRHEYLVPPNLDLDQLETPAHDDKSLGVLPGTGIIGNGVDNRPLYTPAYNGERAQDLFKKNDKVDRQHAPDKDKRYYPAPKNIDGFPDAIRVNPIGDRRRWKLPDKRILEWDKQHGEVEMYDRNGNHLGAYDPKTGFKLKENVPGRKIDL